jgi:hypothetical protein
VVAGFDMPPPAVHILDHATYSNITEQMRSVYRDTMAPVTVFLESELEAQLRGSVRRGASEPDFGDDVYAEFLLDGVLRGDFEQRAAAYQQAINSGWTTPAEVRKLENLPFIEGSDRLYINSTMVPLDVVDVPAGIEGPPGPPGPRGEEGRRGPQGSPGRDGDDGRNGKDGQPGPPGAHGPEGKPGPAGQPGPQGPQGDTGAKGARGPAGCQPTEHERRTVMGRLSRHKNLEEVVPGVLVDGLVRIGPYILAELEEAKNGGDSVAELRERLKALPIDLEEKD